MAFAKLLFNEERCAVGEPGCDPRLGWVHDCRVEHLDIRPAAVVAPGLRLLERGMGEVHLGDSRSLAGARIVARVLNLAAPQRYGRVPLSAGAQQDEYTPPFEDIRRQRVLKD